MKSFEGFTEMEEAELKKLYDSLNLAMTFRDFQHIQKYFRGEEKRDPSVTEIRVLDTYWSDHCRHNHLLHGAEACGSSVRAITGSPIGKYVQRIPEGPGGPVQRPG